MNKPRHGTILVHFFREYPKQVTTISILLGLAGVLELVGVTTFLPLLQVLLAGEGAGQPEGRIVEILTDLDITPDFPGLATVVLVLFCGKAVFLGLAMRYVSTTVAGIAEGFRQRHLQALVSAKWQYFVSHKSGQSLNAISVESFRAASALLSSARFTAVAFQVLVYGISALVIDWTLTLGAMAAAFGIGGLLWVWLRAARAAGFLEMRMAKELLIGMTDMMQGIKPLKAMNRESKLVEFVGDRSRHLRDAQFRQMTSIQYLRIYNEPIMMLVLLAGIWGVFAYTSADIAVLGVMVVIFYRLLTGVNGLQAEYQRLATQEATYWSLQETMREAEQARQHWPGHQHDIPRRMGMEFDAVTFRHGDKSILENLSFQIPANCLSVISGQSGSGKTTCLDLICGFHQVEGGAIRYGTTDITEFDLAAWRRHLGFVPQEVILFNSTIRDNVILGRTGFSDADVWQALEDAEAADFVRNLPDGIDSEVGESGRLLSGGQRQRIAIARAIVGNPGILLLDEATSALDPETERSLLHTIRKLSTSMTVIAVTHNEAVRQAADHVLSLHNGVTADQGDTEPSLSGDNNRS